jgi:UDP-perosamine 4-acetyltransferase
MSEVVGLGAGGHAKVLIEAIRSRGQHEVVALLDLDETLHGTTVLGVPVEGNDDRLPELADEGVEAGFVGVGSVGDPQRRIELFNQLKRAGLNVVGAVHPSAVVGEDVETGRGPIIAPNASLNPGTRIGDNVIVNTGAVVEHNCRLGDHTHVAPGATIGGDVSVGDRSHIGLGAAIRQGFDVGYDAVVGAGAVVIRDVPPDTVVVGVPAEPKESK